MKFGQDDPGFVNLLRRSGYTGFRDTYAPLRYIKEVRFGLITKYEIVFRKCASTFRLEPQDAELLAPRFDALARYLTLEGECVELALIASGSGLLRSLEWVENFFELIYQRGGFRPLVAGPPLSTIAAMPRGETPETTGADV